MTSFLRSFAVLAVVISALFAFAKLDNGMLEVQLVILEDQQPKPVSLQDVTVAKDGSTLKFLARTTGQGMVKMELHPGKYVISTDYPVEHKGKKYSWSKAFEITAGKVNRMVLTQADAVGPEDIP